MENTTTVLDLLIELRSLLGNVKTFHEESARKADRGLILLSAIEGRFGFPSDRPQPKERTKAEASKPPKNGNGSSSTSTTQPKKPPTKPRPLQALAARAANPPGALAAAGPKLGGAKSAGNRRAVQLSTIETKVFRSLESRPGNIVATKDLARTAGLHPFTKVHTVIHRLRGKGYKIESADQARRLGEEIAPDGIRGYRLSKS